MFTIDSNMAVDVFNNVDSFVPNPFKGAVHNPMLVFKQGGVDVSVPLQLNTTYNKLVIPAGTFKAKGPVEATLYTLSETYSGFYDVKAVAGYNPVQPNQYPAEYGCGGSCGNTCNKCNKCPETKVDMTPIYNELNVIREEFKCIYETYESVDAFLDASKETNTNLTELNLTVKAYDRKTAGLENDYDRMAKKVKEILEQFEKFPTIVTLTETINKVEGLRRDYGDIRDLEAELLKLSNALSDFKNSLDKYNFDQIDKNRSDIVKIKKDLQPLPKMAEYFEALYKLRFKLAKIDDLIADIECLEGRIETVEELVNTLNGSVDHALKTANNAMSTANKALAKAESAIISHEEIKKLIASLDDRLNSIEACIEANKINIQTNADNIRRLMKENGELNNKIEALMKSNNAMKNTINKILGSQTSCPTPVGQPGGNCAPKTN